MAQQTELQPTGLPGAVHSFAAKAEAAPVIAAFAIVSHHGTPELPIMRVQWGTDADGDLYWEIDPIEGAVLRLAAQHDASVAGATYDVRLYDELGWDILNGLGANLSFNAVEYAQIYATVYSTLRRSILTAGPLWLEITAGEDTQGTLDLMWTPRVDVPMDRLGLEQ